MASQPRAKILVVDDVPDFCDEVAAILTGANLRPTVCLSPIKAAGLAKKRSFHLIITTLVMEQMSGLDLIRQMRGAQVATPILMVTGHGGPESAIEATRLGANDYLDKPVAADELLARVRAQLADSNRGTSAAVGMDEVITQDLAMREIFEMVETIAPSRSRVLILGETGTGKQILSRAIHTRSDRADQPFVEVNCAAIPETLLESELFGHEKGAFTSAIRRRIGRFEQAREGTIFLDEIGEMNASLQSKLLHVLEDGRFQRVGGTQTLTSRARVVAATNRDLKKEVDAGRFRADLYFRLNVISIAVPPLRERVGDIALLAGHFLEKFCDPAEEAKRFAPDAIAVLESYPWPGNVRELQNLAERLAILHRGQEINASALPERIRGQSASLAASSAAFDGPFRAAKAEFERAYVARAIDRADGNLASAARRSQLDRAQFYRLAQRHGLLPDRRPD
ncbi:MAG: sigma-54 dependent transcriptional regulator [Planctomycetota bacterium]